MDSPQTITEVYEKLAAADEELRKVAQEEDAAGRIMARGFADELHKLAAGPSLQPSATPPPRYAGAGNSLASFARGLAPRAPKSIVTMGKVRRVKPAPAATSTASTIPEKKPMSLGPRTSPA